MIVKIVVSAVVIGIVTEIARKFPAFGGIIAALPLVSLLSISWLHFQGEQNATLSKFAFGVLVGLPATVAMLAIVYLSLKHSLSPFLAIGLGIIGWGGVMVVQGLLFGELKYF